MKTDERLDARRLRREYLRFRAALRDPNTDLYTYTVYFDRVRALLQDRPAIGVLWVGLGDRRLIESVYGWEAFDKLVLSAASFLRETIGPRLDKESLLCTAGVHADAFVLFVPCDRAGRELTSLSLASVATDLRDAMEAHLSREVRVETNLSAGARIGAVRLLDNPFYRFERRVYSAIDQARAMAERPQESERLAWVGELHRVLRKSQVSCVFQPIVEIESGKSVGVEAYARGPESSVFRLPRVMFSLGREAGFLGDLDRLCRKTILGALRGSAMEGWLFLNTHADTLVDPEWCSRETLAMIGAAGLSPDRVVLEIPEGQLSGDLETLRQAMERLRRMGYRISLDDVGSGGRSSQIVDALRPDFVKFDLTLVRGLGRDALRTEIVASLVRLAERSGARLIAERVESHEEVEALLACGASIGQGYYFARETAVDAMNLGAHSRREIWP